MQDFAAYDDGVVAAVCAELSSRVDEAERAGLSRDRLALDPGLGFAKTAEHNWALLRDLDRLAGLGLPLLVGASRKRFLGELLAGPDGDPRPVDEREDANTALTTLMAARGVWCVRVHGARAARDAVEVVARLARPAADPGPAPA
jgi:dihydropteroate synthase